MDLDTFVRICNAVSNVGTLAVLIWLSVVYTRNKREERRRIAQAIEKRRNDASDAPTRSTRRTPERAPQARPKRSPEAPRAPRSSVVVTPVGGPKDDHEWDDLLPHQRPGDNEVPLETYTTRSRED